MNIRVGSKLKVDGAEYKVIGYIVYRNPADNGKRWTEYRLQGRNGERWLSIDDDYKEYSISWPYSNRKGTIGPEWKKVDEGRQVVVRAAGDVDVEAGDSANFIEFEDATEEKILSTEIWDDGTEYSKGEYLDLDEIEITGYEKPKRTGGSGATGVLITLFYFAIFILLCMADSCSCEAPPKQMSEALKTDASFRYVTSITGADDQKADVYEYMYTTTTDDVAKDIIQDIEGNTESVTQKDDTLDEEIAILTKKEYGLVYHPEEDSEKVYVQVSGRKYVYASDNKPYHISQSNHTWYRAHYYSAGYSHDSTSFKHTPSAYTMYQGDTVHNIGNGYFDSYSGSVRQDSIRSRNSSEGGVSSGK